MNAPERHLPLIDIQSQPDFRQMPIQAVGVRGLRYPALLSSHTRSAETVVNWQMTVGLDADVKGTHMSRFVELLEAAQGERIGLEDLPLLTRAMLERLRASTGSIQMAFPWFLRKAAPKSGVESLLDVDVQWRCEIASPDASPKLGMRLTVPVTSLCPCSKEISMYGAHNQRSLISMDVELTQAMSIDALASLAEDCASCAVWGLLKRIDEKHVTETAYENPKFVEDLVRDVALALAAQPQVRRYHVEVENFESIHNHSAYASTGGFREEPTSPRRQ